MIFDNTYAKLGAQFYSSVEITPLKHPKWLIHSDSAFQLIDPKTKSKDDLLPWFNGEKQLPGDQRLSHVYGGHQFGVWAGQLGDGRAISLGEVDGWEIQLKGSGPTPYSRFGDGKAVVRSCIREFLASEALHHLGIPTTRALGVLTGEAPVQREQLEKEALCVRLLQSNIRFGTFEWFASEGDKESLNRLFQYCHQKFFFSSDKDLSSVLREITINTARMVAHWQAFGFCHGVMNTDNMSILGVTLDFGPFGFMENFDFNYICNHSDHQGRYSYGRQPAIALWNLQRLAAVFHFMDEAQDLEAALAEFVPAFEKTYFNLMSEKLGLDPGVENRELIQDLLLEMQKLGMDYSSTFAHFSFDSWEDLPLSEWLRRYKKLRLRQGSQNPIYTLKNYVAERAIREVEDQGSSKLLHKVFDVLKNPFIQNADLDWWSDPSPEGERNLSVSCSS